MPTFLWRGLERSQRAQLCTISFLDNQGPQNKAFETLGSDPLVILNHLGLLFLEY